MYNQTMEVAVSRLRAHLREVLERARAGEDVVVTERGIPVARVVGLDTAPLIERLTAEGVIARPESTDRPGARDRPRVRAKGSVADLVGEQRR